MPPTFTLLLIDGLNLVRRMHASLPEIEQLSPRILHACRKLLRQHQPTHVAIVWDGDDMSWRKNLYGDYKKGRKPMPEALATHLPILKQQLTEAGWFNYQAQSEADDVIASFAHKAVTYQGRVIIVSTDKGFAQLSTLPIEQWDYFAQQAIDHQALFAKWQLRPEQWLEFLALAGDSGNKIPGVAGIGQKTAQQLLQQYQSIHNLYQQLDALKPAIADKLRAGKEEARLSYQLVKLQQQLPLEVQLKALRCPQ